MNEFIAECRCGETTLEVIQCPEHHHLFRAGRRLKSVGSIIRESFPMDPSIPPEVLENARMRGDEVDRLFCEYVETGRLFVPKGTMRQDSKALLMKLVVWYDKQNFSEVKVQVPLGDTDHGGVVDLIIDGVTCELKATSKVEHTHRLQAAAYAELNAELNDGGLAGMILHVTERYTEPRIEKLTATDFHDWRLLRDCWRMVQRRMA